VKRLTVSVEESAQMLGISRALAYELVRKNEIPSIKLGRRLVVPLAALLRLLQTPEVDDMTIDLGAKAATGGADETLDSDGSAAGERMAS
jgi:excisionase family DNA binding protein